MRRIAALAGVAMIATACSSQHTRTLGGYGISVSLPRGWYGLAAPGQLQIADFPLAHNVLASAESARVRRGHVHLVVWDIGAAVPYLAQNHPPVGASFALRHRDVTDAPFEGFPFGHAYARRAGTFDGHQVDVLADLGPGPVGANRLADANRVLATMTVRPPRVIRPRDGVVAADGLALRLLPGWTGRIELPANRHATRLALRARRGDARVVLIELPSAFEFHSRQIRLPIAVTTKNLVPGAGGPISRRVFSANGRNFDLSVIFATKRDLAQANRLLAGLKVEPKSWTAGGCDVTLRLPGTWTFGVRRRGGCYLVFTLRGRGIRIVVTELRPNEHPSGLALRRAGRRFHVDIFPRSAKKKAAPYAILGTLRAKPLGIRR